MDERELGELFRSVPGQPPPPSFDESDVAHASHRITVRRRAIAGGAAAAVVLLGGGGVVAGSMLGGGGGGNVVAGSDRSTTGGTQPRIAQPGDGGSRPQSGQPGIQGLPSDEPKQGGTADGDRTQRCDQVDRELATALAGELPVTASDASPGRFCPEGTTSASFRVNGSALTAVLVPEGTQVQLPGELSDAETAEQNTASGSTLLLLNEPLTRADTDGPDVDRIAKRVAGEL
ncbi:MULTISPECIES: hypothetical protein [Prauserella salsuginis group]|uniref:DUF3558 domain-containing protein n=1 Tax=Prauserella salsuginis TaxID=387889 RepID=A0ABW6G0F1_9PSEU|nr:MULTISPECIES: hypothetical protein [Prauserella salsuginis group]MCR3721285.1 hypothetical protein [Prauserella flava]MCR3734635.1 hypothetical protein [Prauserella salsuginis]